MPDFDLISLAIGVKPLTPAAPEPQTTTAQAPNVKHYGRAAHALLLDAVREADPALAQSLHDTNGLKPITTSDLLGYSPRRGLEAGRMYTLRFTALTRPAAAALLAAAHSGPLRPGAEIRLAEDGFEIQEIKSQISKSQGPNSQEAKVQEPQSVWSGCTTYEALSAPWLLGKVTPEWRVALRFASPTTFKSQEKHVPVPLPGLVFGSLLDKWNAFAPVALPPEARRFAEECLALSGFELQSRPAYLKEGGVRVGAVGVARYTALNRDRYWLSVVNLLADFALFAGVGAGTTMGLGQVRAVG